MKVKIVGYEDRTYTDKSTGEVKELLEIFFEKAPKNNEKFVGVQTGSETLLAKAFPEQYEAIKRAGEKIIGKSAIISKDVRTFKGSSFPVLDEFEILA